MPPKRGRCVVCDVIFVRESVHAAGPRGPRDPELLFLRPSGEEVWICGKKKCYQRYNEEVTAPTSKTKR